MDRLTHINGGYAEMNDEITGRHRDVFNEDGSVNQDLCGATYDELISLGYVE